MNKGPYQEKGSIETGFFFDENAVDTPEGEGARAAIHAFISQRFPAVSCFMITHRKNGLPSIRQVGVFVEGWTVNTVSQSTHLKNKHVKNNPNVTYLWVGLTPNEHFSVPNVMLQGTCEIVTDKDEIDAFLERRSKGRGEPRHGSPYERLLLKTTPTVIRAEGFTGPRAPVFLRTFDRTGEEA